MEEDTNVTWRTFSIYLIIVLLVMWAGVAKGQISVAYFNADWNKANGVAWIDDLKEVNTLSYVDVATQNELATKHKIAVIPTLIIFKDNEEVARFQADLSFKMVATRKDVQEEIDNILMSDF